MSALPKAVPAVPAASFSTVLILGTLAAGTALGPWSSKIAGATWLVWSLWGLLVGLGPRFGARPAPHPGLPAARWLFFGFAITTVLALCKALYWHDPFDEMYGYLRLTLSAAAACWVLERVLLPAATAAMALRVLAVQCIAALICLASLAWRYYGMDFRNMLPANAIPWAQAVAFAVCLLMPAALAGRVRPGTRAFLWLGVALGGATVLASLSRGAYGIFFWMGWLLAARWRDVHGRWPWGRLSVLGAAFCLALAAVWCVPGDPLRLRLAEKEISQAETHSVFDTSLGTRMYLWTMAWQGLKDSPWMGVGETERMYRIKHAGEELPPAQREGLAYVRTMGHVHNQYLHAALDGGILGLAGMAALILGMAVAAWRLRAVDKSASRQMQGLLFVHTLGGMSNVNFAHTYYVVTLAVATAAVFVCMRPAPPAIAQP
ncbi:O-antigen ligase domain-containing protein [Xylophilus rhododendri]|uniref:O-antigen ligase domain-containing protein n=1 Tax=Xylophilus rhododendri TaxID=2697032 RepID=A0A857J5P8_9BURK|nr:O-antigen ligase family protein [Xylophilus rhododendri]QHI99037.1 O-antigen ligase domain-containing protein [Xylophilus rhododendri]